MDKQMIGMCGAYCGVCEWKDKIDCKGCQISQGKMFWGECAVAKCAMEKGFNHCGHCSELPCETLQGFFNDPEHGDQGERLANLQAWAEGSDKYLKLRKLKSDMDQ